jgi:hypothetical protein
MPGVNIVTEGGEFEMNREQFIHKIYDDYTENIHNGKLLDSVEDYIRNYVTFVNEGIGKIKKYISREVEIEFDDRNAFAHIRIKENSISFYRRQDRIEVAITRNGDKREDQMIVVENLCRSRMYDISIQDAMDKYINLAFN